MERTTGIRQTALFLAWLIAVIAVASTLYGGEFRGLPICHLCWYQRICIYPLFFILGMGAFADDPRCIRYAMPLVVLGFLFALYQYLQQMIPGFAPINVCGTGVDCATTHMKVWGFITLPFLSMLASLLIFILLLIARSQKLDLLDNS